MTTINDLEARRLALDYAFEWHKRTGTSRPVLDQAEEYYRWLTGTEVERT